MFNLNFINIAVCRIAVVAVAVLAARPLFRSIAGNPRSFLKTFGLLLAPFLAGLAMRIIAPWGPGIDSGRDLFYFDPVFEGTFQAHSYLLSAAYYLLRFLDAPLAGLVWGQMVLGALGCVLVSVLTFELVHRNAPAIFAGLLAAVLVVLARVDASPSQLVIMRLFLLLALIFAVRYKRTLATIDLVTSSLALVATSYGRLESPLLVFLVLVFLAWNPPADDRQQTMGGCRERRERLWLACLILCLSMLAALVSRWSLLPAIVAVAVLLVRVNRGRLAPLAVMLAGAGIALVLLPRAYEIFTLERETSSRFPVSLLYLFGHLNIFLFDPELCTSLVPVFAIVGLLKRRREESSLMHYLALVAVPIATFYLLFMGDTSARIKLQGTGIMLLLPLSGLGVEYLVGRLKHWRQLPNAWNIVAALSIVAVSVPLGYGKLRTITTLQQEYRFLLSLSSHLDGRHVLFALPPSQTDTLITIPKIIQRRSAFRLILLGRDPKPQKGDLVYLGAGCFRFRDGESLPATGKTLTKSVLQTTLWPRWELIARIMWDKNKALRQVFDSLLTNQRDICKKWRRDLGLVPVFVKQAVRTSLDGRLMPKRFPFGLYRVTKVH